MSLNYKICDYNLNLFPISMRFKILSKLNPHFHLEASINFIWFYHRIFLVQ